MKLTHGCAYTHVPIISLQIRCHADSQSSFINPLFMNRFQDYKTVFVQEILFLGFSCEIRNVAALLKCTLLWCQLTHSNSRASRYS
jgi:hypothetical protein